MTSIRRFGSVRHDRAGRANNGRNAQGGDVFADVFQERAETVRDRDRSCKSDSASRREERIDEEAQRRDRQAQERRSSKRTTQRGRNSGASGCVLTVSGDLGLVVPFSSELHLQSGGMSLDAGRVLDEQIKQPNPATQAGGARNGAAGNTSSRALCLQVNESDAVDQDAVPEPESSTDHSNKRALTQLASDTNSTRTSVRSAAGSQLTAAPPVGVPDPDVYFRTVKLNELALRVIDGEGTLDIEIAREQAALNVKVVAAPETIDQLNGLENEVDKALNDMGMSLESFTAEARDGDGDESGESNGHGDSPQDETQREQRQSVGSHRLLDIRV